MGFNKKYISIDTLQKYIDNGCPIWKVFNSDALFFCDSKSAKIYDLFLEGVEEKKLKDLIEYESRKQN